MTQVQWMLCLSDGPFFKDSAYKTCDCCGNQIGVAPSSLKIAIERNIKFICESCFFANMGEFRGIELPTLDQLKELKEYL